MADQKQYTWNLGPTSGLSQRGFALGEESTILEADNLNFLTDAFASMRNAFTDEDLTGSGLTGEILWLGRHVTNDGEEERWAASNNSGTVACARFTNGSWSSVTLIDSPVAASLSRMHSVTFNGKLYLAYDNAENRLHLWDGTAVRRVGLIASGVGSVADTGAGSYAATARYYRFSQRIKSGTDIQVESELSAAVSFTPSGSGTAAQITKPATVDSATHWVVYGLIGSSGDTYDLYEEIAEIAIGTTTYDDSVDPSSYDGDAPPLFGSNIPPPSVKYLATDGSRVIMAGAWKATSAAGETAPASNRAWFTRANGATDVGDDESIPDGLWLNIGDAGPVTGLGRTYTDVYVFKFGAVHKLIPTQDPEAPFSRVLISENYGAVGQRCIANGETEDGYSALYFADDHAVYRLAYGAVVPYSEPVGRDMRAQPITADGSLVAYDPYRRVLLPQISNSATGVLGNYSAFVSDAVKKRWSGFSLGGQTSGWTLGSSRLGTSTILAGGSATIRAAVVAQASDGTLRLFVGGQDDSGNAVLRSWGKRNGLDGETAFTMRIRARKAFGPGKRATIWNPVIYYRNPQGDTSGELQCSVSLIGNYNAQTITQTFTMAASQDDNGIAVNEQVMESVEMGDVSVLDLVIATTWTPTVAGTGYDSVVTPTIDAVIVPYKLQEAVGR
jgi:hypothetical protein